MNTPTENWKDVPGYEGRYQVSDLGRVKSLERKVSRVSKNGVPSGWVAPSKVLTPVRETTYGHLRVTLGHSDPKRLHGLVALAFIGPRPDGFEVAHLNGDPSDNRLENLAYVTPSANQRHRVYHGTTKISIDEVKRIKRLAENATPADKKAIAKALNVTPQAVQAVMAGRSYGYI